jgi:hypothetical protein
LIILCLAVFGFMLFRKKWKGSNNY